MYLFSISLQDAPVSPAVDGLVFKPSLCIRAGQMMSINSGKNIPFPLFGLFSLSVLLIYAVKSFSFRISCISRINLMTSYSLPVRFLTTLRATIRPVTLHVPFETQPKLPFPITSRTVYF